jgi:SAM-dependent methyltransferase
VTELARSLIDEGRRVAAEQGWSHAIEFHYGDAFALFPESACFDLVYWDNSLHHMMDVHQAVEWSFKALRPGGLFIMNDFVGATRMQFSDEMLDAATYFRQSLPASMLRNPFAAGELPRVVGRCDPVALADDDPSECADSGRILDSVREAFPDAEIIPTGGAIYHAALSDVLANFDEVNEVHTGMLNLSLLLDEQLAKRGLTHYAFAAARRPL